MEGGTILPGMIWTGALLLLCIACSAAGQSANSDDPAAPHFVIRNLAQFAYPPRARFKAEGGRNSAFDSIDVLSEPELLAARGTFSPDSCRSAISTGERRLEN